MKSLIVFILCSYAMFAQNLPLTFEVGTKYLSKVQDDTPLGNSIERILIQGNSIWLATSKGLSRSSDDGATWKNYYNSAEFGTDYISAVAYNNGIIWAATWKMENQFNQDIPVGTGIKYSTNDGQTWTSIQQPIDLPSDTVTVYGNNLIKTLPKTNTNENFTYGFAFTNNTIWIVSARGGLRKSTNMGQTWQRVVLPPDNLDSIRPSDNLNFQINHLNIANHIPLSILAIDDQTLFVGTGGGLNKSTDGGNSWVKFTKTNQQRPIIGNNIFAIELNRHDNSLWISSTSVESPGVSVSYDLGLNWENFLSGEKVRGFGFKYYGNENSYTSSDVFAASGSGLYRTNNKGTTWLIAPPIIDEATKYILNTKEFLSVKTVRKNDGTTNIWVGTSRGGLARFNETSGSWIGSWKIFLSKEKIDNENKTYAFPNPFNPNSNISKIVYSLNSPSNVTIRILDFGMNLVRTIIQNAPRGISNDHLETWDGKDQQGKIVPNGVYFYRIDFGSEKPLFGKIMVLM